MMQDSDTQMETERPYQIAQEDDAEDQNADSERTKRRESGRAMVGEPPG